MVAVSMTHPNLPDHPPATTTSETFDRLWKDKGWQLVADESAPVPAEQLKGQALEDALKDAGLPSTGTADDKRAALAAHYGQEG